MTNEIKLIVKAFDETRGAFQSVENSILKLKNSINLLNVGLGALASAFALNKLKDAFNQLIEAADKYYTTIAEISAVYTSFTRIPSDRSISEVYRQWYEYSEAIYEKMLEIDSQILGTRQQALQMVSVFAQNGVVLDINNQKQLEGFRNIMNAVMVLTQGQNQEIQLRQEINALLDGTINQNSRLMQLLNSITPNIKEQLKLWQEQGILIEKVGELLTGFNEAASDLENTFEAQKTMLSGIVNDLLREGFQPLLKVIIEYLKSIISYLLEHKEQIISVFYVVSDKLASAWRFVVETVKLLIRPLKDVYEILKDGILIALNVVIRALSYLIGVILPTLLATLTNVYRVFRAITSSAVALGAVLTGNIDYAKKMWDDAKKSITNMHDVIGIYEAGQKNVKQFWQEMQKGIDGLEAKRKKIAEKPLFELFKPKDKEGKTKTIDIERLRGEYEELMLEIKRYQLMIVEQDLIMVDKWQQDKINKLKEYFKKGVITEEEFQNARVELEASVQKRKSEILDRYNKTVKEIERDITEKILSEQEKRLNAVDMWLEQTIERIKTNIINHEKAEELITRAKEVALKEREKIENEYNARIETLRVKQEQARLDVSYASREITREEYLRRRIELEQQLISILEQQANYEARRGNVEAFLELGERIENIRERLIELNNELKSVTGTALEGFIQGIKDYLEQLPSSFESARQGAREIISDMGKAFTNFFDVTSKNFMNFKSLVISILQTIYKELLKVLLIQPLMRAIGIGFTGIFGGFFAHEGGLITAHSGGKIVMVPRLHLGSDEVPAILQTGERVLSRRQNKMFESLMEKLINIDRSEGISRQVQIINVLDPQLMGQYLSSVEGQNAILNIISHRSPKVIKILQQGV